MNKGNFSYFSDKNSVLTFMKLLNGLIQKKTTFLISLPTTANTSM